eukprot:gene15240-20541_t
MNVKSLSHTTIERDEEEIDNLYVNDKFYINHDEQKENVNDRLYMIKTDINEITKYVKQYATDDKKKKENLTLRLILESNEDLSTLLIDIYKIGYIPNVYFNRYVYKLTLQFDNILVSVENPDIYTQTEHIIHVANTKEYEAFQKADFKLNKEIMKDEYLSTYHQTTVLDIEDKYTISSDCGLLETIVDKDNSIKERQPDLYIVNVKKSKRLVNGLSPIKDIIYCRQKLLLYKQYFKFKQLGYTPVAIKTDCMYYRHSQKIPIQNQLRNNFDFTENKIGAFKKETDEKNIERLKFQSLLKVDCNERIEVRDFQTIEPKIFKDEYDKKAINKYIMDNKVVMLRGVFPGVGKTDTVLNLGLKTLFVLPENTLARDIKKQGHDAITINKLFGLDANDKSIKSSKFDISEYQCICFDEIAKHNIDRLIRISNFIEDNQDKIIIGSGDDTNQIKPISYK